MSSNLSNSQHINIIEIGEVSIIKSKKCKRLCIYVNKSKSVKVSIPFNVSFKEGERFLLEKMEWIKKSLRKIDNYNNQTKIIDKDFIFKTRSKVLKLVEGKSFKYIYDNKREIEINYPKEVDLKNEKSQVILKKMIVECIRCEAKEYFPLRVAELAEIHNFHYNTVKIRNSITRWGSCSSKNNISLSLYLAILPDSLSDYVIQHELSHTVYKNHGPLFWNLLEKVSGDIKSKIKQLKQYKPGYIF